MPRCRSAESGQWDRNVGDPANLWEPGSIKLRNGAPSPGSSSKPSPPTPTTQHPASRAMFIPPRPRALVFFAFLALFGVSYLVLDWPTTHEFPPAAISFLDPTGPQVLLVSAFYPLAKSKHTEKEYAAWMTLYLSKIKTHIYFFAPPEIEGMVRKLRGNLPMTLNTSFASPFDIPPLKGLEGRYAEMNKVDPENAYHSSELYAVWSSKTYFLREALLNMQSAGMDVAYAFWNDAGSFREKQDFANWPALERVDEIFTQGANLSSMDKDDLFFMPMWDVPKDPLRDWTPLEGPKEYYNAISEGQPVAITIFRLLTPFVGSFFGGRPNVIHWWYKTYWA